MRKLLYPLIFLLAFSAYTQSINYVLEEEYLEYKKNGILYYKGTPFNGKTFSLHSNGELKDKQGYKNGISNGVKWYYTNGQLEKKVNKRIIKRYHYNGQLRSKEKYKNAIRNSGKWYYSNGQLNTKGKYKDGKEDGLWEYYLKDGQLNSKGKYKDGKEDGLWEEYYTNGQLNKKGKYKDGKEDGLWEYYLKDGQFLKLKFKDGEMDEWFEAYSEDGQLIINEEELNKLLDKLWKSMFSNF